MFGKTLVFVASAAAFLGNVHAGKDGSDDIKCGDRRGYARFSNGQTSCYNEEDCYNAVMLEGAYQIKSGDYLEYGAADSDKEYGGNRRLVERRLWNCQSGGTEYYCLFDPRYAKRQLRGLQDAVPFEDECWGDVTNGDEKLFNKQMDDIVGAAYQLAIPVTYNLQDYICGCD